MKRMPISAPKDDEIWNQLKKAADDNGMSINEFVMNTLKAALEPGAETNIFESKFFLEPEQENSDSVKRTFVTYHHVYENLKALAKNNQSNVQHYIGVVLTEHVGKIKVGK